MLRKIIINSLFLSISLALAKEVPVSEYFKIDTQEIKNFLSEFIHPGDLVFDVGAHIGKKSDIYLSLGAKIICVEPQPECIVELIKKFGDIDRVEIEPVGLSSEDGYLEFFQCSTATTISTFSFEYTQKGRFFDTNYKWDHTIQIPVTTLDAIIKKYGTPTFCKIDVENFEYQVLSGLSVPIKYISFESNTEWIENTKKCVLRLKSLGYKKFNFAIAERGWFMLDEWLPAEIFIEQLVVASQDVKWQEIGGLWGDVYAQY